MEEFKVQAEQFERAGDYGKVAELRYGKMVELQKQLDEDQAKLAELQKTSRMLKEEVTEEDVAEVVAKWTGVPVSKMLEGEMRKLVKMEDRLGVRVIGQNDALSQWRTPCAVLARACKTRDVRSVPLSFWVPPG